MMESTFPLLFAAVVGFGHAFEADHLVAVGNIVTRRGQVRLALKDGMFWGLGHTSTICAIGLLMVVGKALFLNGYFKSFEAAVGLMLVALGIVRLVQYARRGEEDLTDDSDNHHLAYGVGLVHGLAGSGAMVLLVMANIQGSLQGMAYLLIFGLGSVVGMLVAAGIFSLPFSKKWSANKGLQLGLVMLSSLLCIGYGSFVILENIG